MRIGDKVRFLNQTGGGVVVGFGKKGWVTIQDEDGFDIPVPEKECVVVEENVVAKEEVNIQTKDGDKLDIAIIYTGKSGQYTATVANECNYNLFVTYTAENKEQRDGGKDSAEKRFVTLFAAELLPYQRKEMFRFGISDLNNNSKRVIVRVIPFKRSTSIKINVPHKIKPIIEQTFTLDPTNLLKESLFKANDYLKERGYVVKIADENGEHPIESSLDGTSLKQALKTKFEGEKEVMQGNAGAKGAAGAKGGAAVGKGMHNRAYVDGRWVDIPDRGLQREWLEDTALIKVTFNGVMEVDLHASMLLDTTIGMDNTAILKYQLEKFNEAMTAVLHKRGSKIVFIHGKGDGVLRKAIIDELKRKYSRCKWQDASFQEYGYGATMVTIN